MKLECDAITKAAKLRFLQDVLSQMLIFESLGSSQERVSGDDFGKENRSKRPSKIDIEVDWHWQRPSAVWQTGVRGVGGLPGGSKDPPKSKI